MSYKYRALARAEAAYAVAEAALDSAIAETFPPGTWISFPYGERRRRVQVLEFGYGRRLRVRAAGGGTRYWINYRSGILREERETNDVTD